MPMQQPSPGILLAGILGLAVVGCSDSGDAADDGVTNSETQTAGGPTAGGTGSPTSGGTAQTTGGPATSMASATTNGGGTATSAGSSGMGAPTTGPGGTGTASGGGGNGTDGMSTSAGGAMDGTTTSVGGGGSTATAATSTTGDLDGPCTESQPAGTNASGSGPHDVIVETNSDPGIKEGTIFRPADLGGSEQYPIFVWGEGGCSQDGLSNATAMAEIASHGYFVIADGTPNGSGNRVMDRSSLEAMGAPLIAYIDWAIAENQKPCSAYYHSLDTTKLASNGFSCGGLMSQGTVTDPRIITWGVTSSGMAGAVQAFYDTIHTPVLFVEGGADDIAYDGGLEGYEKVSELNVPVLWFSKALGHGGDLFQADGGDFTRINLAWLNWWLKGDETATGKGLLVGPDCPYCGDSAWEVMSTNIP